MTTMTYKEQLLHPNWQRKRLEVMQEVGFKCEACGTDEITLNVHHRRYVKGRKVWEYELHELACLCQPCHRQEHQHRELLDLLLLANDGGALQQAIGLLGGFLDGDLLLDADAAAQAGEVGAPYFDLGLLASIVLGTGPRGYLRVVEALQIESLNPAQEAAIEKWRRDVGLSDAMEDAGL